MKNKFKVTIIILIQIGIILGSFLTLAIFESETALLGNSINIAGKNRLLSSEFVNEIKDYAYLNNPEANPQDKLAALEENIHLLKNGGMLNENKIPMLNPEFKKEWNKIEANFIALKTEYLVFKEKENFNFTYEEMANVEQNFNLFLESSDELAEKLGNHVKKLSERLIILELLLLILNVAIHVELIIIITRIYRKEFEKSKKLEKLAVIGELSARLSHDMRNPLSNLKMSLELIDARITDESSRDKLKINNNN
ncbi:MAG: hypothetical protein ACE5RG_09320 [Candidatus Nitrosomaritimum yanchengensis]